MSKTNGGNGKKITARVHNAHAVGVPLIAITTGDPIATQRAIFDGLKLLPGGVPAYVSWTCSAGLVGVNTEGVEWCKTLDPFASQSPQGALAEVQRLPANSVVVMHHLSRFWDSPVVMQGIQALRSQFEVDSRLLIVLAPSIQLPVELLNDVLVFQEELPTREEIRAIVDEAAKAGAQSSKTFVAPDTQREALTDALTGTIAFSASQRAYMAMTPVGFDIERAWEGKRQALEQIRGLTFDRYKETFEAIGGVAEAKRVFGAFFAGPARPRIVVRMDELEKMLAGANPDMPQGDTGVAQDAAAAILREMEDNDWDASLFIGPPGCTKSMFSKAVGPTFGVPSLQLDMGAAKGRYVGESEEYIRACLRAIYAMAAERVLFIGTANRISTLTPEMQRRFQKGGVWYFGLPSEDEKALIWPIQIRRYGLDGRRQPLPDDARWTGADIRTCCYRAWALSLSLVEAARTFVPVARLNAKAIEQVETLADGTFLSASQPGVYERIATPRASGRRRVAVGEDT